MIGLDDWRARLGEFDWVILAASGLVALFLSTVFQRLISVPILDLAKTAGLVTDNKDYSVRAVKRNNDFAFTIGQAVTVA